MESIWRRGAVLAVIALLAACSTPSPQEQTESAERAALAPLKTHYPDVVMGFDFHGNELDISIDLDSLISMDEPKEDQLKAEAVKRWRSTWTAAHPNAHAKLTIRFIDFKGSPQYTATTAS